MPPRARTRRTLGLLLLLVSLALLLRYGVGAGPVPVFLASAVAIVPLAAVMGRATEELAGELGEGLGGLLNATFGNAAELIIALVALGAGLHDVVKASLTGSIIGNVLLVFGLGALLGGLRRPVQRFNRTAASLGATMLVLSVVALVVPALFHVVVAGRAPEGERELSLEIAVVLFLTYLLSLVFALGTHRHLYGLPGRRATGLEEAGGGTGPPGPTGGPAGAGGGGVRRRRALLALLLATGLVVWMSQILVGTVEEAAGELGMNPVFVGVILVALIGNAAEHSTAVFAAIRDRMDLALQIAVGSSIQIALFVAPLLVFLSYGVGPLPMDLLFTPFEVAAVALASGIIALIALDGESNWMEGVQLLAVYLILGLGFYFLPG